MIKVITGFYKDMRNFFMDPTEFFFDKVLVVFMAMVATVFGAFVLFMAIALLLSFPNVVGPILIFLSLFITLPLYWHIKGLATDD